MYTIFPLCYVNRRNVTSWRILVTPLAAPSIIKQVRHCLAKSVFTLMSYFRSRFSSNGTQTQNSQTRNVA
jgi:hypothetical protein